MSISHAGKPLLQNEHCVVTRSLQNINIRNEKATKIAKQNTATVCTKLRLAVLWEQSTVWLSD